MVDMKERVYMKEKKWGFLENEVPLANEKDFSSELKDNWHFLPVLQDTGSFCSSLEDDFSHLMKTREGQEHTAENAVLTWKKCHEA